MEPDDDLDEELEDEDRRQPILICRRSMPTAILIRGRSRRG